MSSILDSYEREFSGLMADIARRTTAIPDLTGDERKTDLRAAGKDVEDAKGAIEQMELEIMDVPAAHRAQTKKRIESYKAQLQEAEQKLRRASVATGAKAARDELFAYDGTSEDQREMLLSNTERLSRTSRRLDEGHRVAIETQDVAMTIMSDLHDQRETIERSRGRLKQTDGVLARSQRVLGSMYNRAIRNRVVTALIILFCIGVIGIIIYLIANK